jgi:hypothetical protein
MSVQLDHQLINQLAQGIAQGIAQSGMLPGAKTVTGTPTTNWIHGPGGILGSCAIDQQVISARITPMGLSSYLPITMSRDTNPEFAYITGMEPHTTTEPNGVCEDCPSGITQSCIQTAQFGRVCRETKEMDIDRTIERVNKGEVDLQLVNDILGIDPSDVFRAIQTPDSNTVLNVATAWGMVEVGMMFQQALVPMTFQGNPVNNTPGGGYKEFPGLDILISTNKVDAHTGANCAALDSDVKSFNWQDVASVDANGNFRIVSILSMLESFVHRNAMRMKLMPATWVWAMREELWYELTKIWPVAYYTNHGITTPPPGASINIDGVDMTQLRDEMRRGMFLDLNGRRWPVVIDDGIFEYDEATGQGNLAAGEFASNIYLVPLTAAGQRMTYYEAKDYRFTAAEVAASPGNMLQRQYHTDDGRFMWTMNVQNWCYILLGKVEPRIILKAPMLAGRLDLVKYTPVQHFRDFDTTSDYFVKGGEPSRPSPSLWSDWNLPPTFSR